MLWIHYVEGKTRFRGANFFINIYDTFLKNRYHRPLYVYGLRVLWNVIRYLCSYLLLLNV